MLLLPSLLVLVQCLFSFLVAFINQSDEISLTHLCSRVLVGLIHQVIKRHVLGHGHVAELERKYLTSGWSIWKRHIDDSVKATWTHQSLWDRKKRTVSLR